MYLFYSLYRWILWFLFRRSCAHCGCGPRVRGSYRARGRYHMLYVLCADTFHDVNRQADRKWPAID